MSFFDNLVESIEACKIMDMNQVGAQVMNTASSAYLGYAARIEELNTIVDVALASNERHISLARTCRLAGIDPNLLTEEEIRYIVKEFDRRERA